MQYFCCQLISLKQTLSWSLGCKIMIRDTIYERKRQEAQMGRGRSWAVVKTQQSFSNGQELRAIITCAHVQSLGAVTGSVYPCLTQSPDTATLEQCESGQACLCSRGTCWKSWELTVLLLTSPQWEQVLSCRRSVPCTSMSVISICTHTHTPTTTEHLELLWSTI